MKQRIIFGLTGLIGSGKSSVAEYFAKHNAEIIDTDLIAHQLTAANGVAIKPIIGAFGHKLIKGDGSLDRDKMRNLVFANSNAKEVLERILHELIYQEVLYRLKISSSNCIVIVVPLLFKVPKYLALIDKSIFIDCDESKLIERVKLRSQLGEDLIRAILEAQIPREQQLKMADEIIQNNGSELELEEKVSKLYYKYMHNIKKSN